VLLRFLILYGSTWRIAADAGVAIEHVKSRLLQRLPTRPYAGGKTGGGESGPGTRDQNQSK
jgi:hypothetical protein